MCVPLCREHLRQSAASRRRTSPRRRQLVAAPALLSLGRRARTSADKMASITCQCGAVQINMSTSESLHRLECCCHDCASAFWYCHHKKNGPALRPSHQLASCLDTNFFPNDFTIVKGEDQIGCFMNKRIDADSRRFHCKACWTILLTDHPAYCCGALVMTQVTNYSNKLLSNAKLAPVTSRQFIKDLSAKQTPALPRLADGQKSYDGVSSVLTAALENLVTAHIDAAERASMNSQILSERVSPPFIPDDELVRWARSSIILTAASPRSLFSSAGPSHPRASPHTLSSRAVFVLCAGAHGGWPTQPHGSGCRL